MIITPSLPATIAPMLPVSGRPFDSSHHRFEPKWDGLRCIAFCGGSTRLQSRNLRAMEGRFPELGTLHRRLRTPLAILDGEIVILDASGRPDFDAVRDRNLIEGAAAARLARQRPAAYVAFDLLYAEGEPLLERPLAERIERLKEAVSEGDGLALCRGIVGPGADYYAAALDQGFEGVVAKRLDSPYTPGRRSPHWVKIRRVRSFDGVIAGFVPRGPQHVAALLLAGCRDGRLFFTGRVGTGWSEAESRDLAAQLGRLGPAPCPLAHPVTRAQAPRETIWVAPRLVCSVDYLERSSQGLRHPVFRGLRDDKPPEACQLPGDP